MKCPIDGSDLVMTDRQGIEIDYCPKCRGVWLDRGELDKIIDRTAAPVPQQASFIPQQAPPSAPYPQQPHDPRQGYDARYDQRYDPRHKKKKSLLGEIFDF